MCTSIPIKIHTHTRRRPYKTQQQQEEISSFTHTRTRNNNNFIILIMMVVSKNNDKKFHQPTHTILVHSHATRSRLSNSKITTNERYKSNMSLDFSKRFDVCTNFINGKFESAGKTMDVFDPSTGDKITKVHLSTKDDVDVRYFRSSISLMNDSSTPLKKTQYNTHTHTHTHTHRLR